MQSDSVDNISDSETYFFEEVPVKLKNKMHLGDHLIIDLSGCDPELLLNPERSRDLFFNAVKDAGLTVVSEGFYQFSPHGFTCFLLLAESHASLHAWPEYGYLAIDLFTCNLGCDLNPLVGKIQEVFGAKSISVRSITRTAQVEKEVVFHAYQSI